MACCTVLRVTLPEQTDVCGFVSDGRAADAPSPISAGSTGFLDKPLPLGPHSALPSVRSLDRRSFIACTAARHRGGHPVGEHRCLVHPARYRTPTAHPPATARAAGPPS